MLGTLLVVFLVLALVGALPRWSHSWRLGVFPHGGGLLIVLVLLALGRL